MKQLILVFLGGGLGSVSRYGIGKLLKVNTSSFPWGTFTVNLLGSFIIGLIFGYLLTKHKSSDYIYLLLATGFCGGFTTFSTFAHESFTYLKSGEYSLLAAYIASSLVFGMMCVGLGYWTYAKIA